MLAPRSARKGKDHRLKKALIYKSLVADYLFPFVHQSRFYHTTSHYLCHKLCYRVCLVEIALGCPRNLMIYSKRFTPTFWPNRFLTSIFDQLTGSVLSFQLIFDFNRSLDYTFIFIFNLGIRVKNILIFYGYCSNRMEFESRPGCLLLIHKWIKKAQLADRAYC